MAKTKWITSKKHPGVKYRESGKRGRLFYIVYGRAGKNYWEKVGYEDEGYSLALAATVRANRIKAIRHGDELPQDRAAVLTLNDVAVKYMEWAAASKRSGRDDASRYEHYWKRRFGNRFVDEITPLDLERVKRELLAEGKSPATVKQALALVRAIYNRGIEWGLIKVLNPMRAVKMPRIDNARERLLTPDEIELLFTELKRRSPQGYELALVAYNTGARFGEIAKLCWEDVDLRLGVLVFRTTKNYTTRRVPCNSEMKDFFAAKAESVEVRTGLVFPSRTGIEISLPTNAFQRVADDLFNSHLAKNDRRNKVVFHSLRHAFASRLVAEGIPLNVVKELTGHKTLAMLERYSHVMPGATKNAVELLRKKHERAVPELEVVANAY